ncbi:hypothetical protein [Daejeonella sp. H1SJ63]|uniref:hypothetical protein n=1 Tax=Daejeonella sp. H1SJ63 TaxID=3034145 RepID=UPI0023EC89C7|nr:hypothetical protein [Daejeonella sp. H1SJ63]
MAAEGGGKHQPTFQVEFKLYEMRKYLPYIITLLIFCATISSCKKSKPQNEDACPGFDLVPSSPYEDPVWHPSGNIIGFNHTPLKEIKYTYGYDCPRQAAYIYNPDSTGFWLVNADGTNKRRILPYKLQNPAWSPDGKWIAFVQGTQIYKMPFDGEKFDETAKVQLTFSGRNFFPAWSPDGEWIAYDSNADSPTGLNFIWKMDKNGFSKKRIAFTPDQGETRMPSWSNNYSIVHQRYINITYPEVFKMDSAGNNVLRLTTNTNFERCPKYSANGAQIAFTSQSSSNGDGVQVWTISSDGTNMKQLTTDGTTGFSWSPDGRIVYVRFDYTRLDESRGVLWTMNSDGSNKKQLTYNQFKITQ